VAGSEAKADWPNWGPNRLTPVRKVPGVAKPGYPHSSLVLLITVVIPDSLTLIL